MGGEHSASLQPQPPEGHLRGAGPGGVPYPGHEPPGTWKGGLRAELHTTPSDFRPTSQPHSPQGGIPVDEFFFMAPQHGSAVLGWAPSYSHKRYMRSLNPDCLKG